MDLIGTNSTLVFLKLADLWGGSSVTTISFSRIIFSLLLVMLLYCVLSSMTFLYSKVPLMVYPLISVMIITLKLSELSNNSIKLYFSR